MLEEKTKMNNNNLDMLRLEFDHHITKTKTITGLFQHPDWIKKLHQFILIRSIYLNQGGNGID